MRVDQGDRYCCTVPEKLLGQLEKIMASSKQTEFHEDVRVKPVFFHRPSIASTDDSAESIATPPPESDFTDEQTRNMLAKS